MKCKNCGFQIKENKKFCTNCGWEIEVSVAKKEVKKVIPTVPIKNIEEDNKVENKEKKFNKPLLFVIGLASLGGLLGIAQYVSNENLYTYEDQNSDYQFYSFLDLDDRISRNPSDSDAFLQRSRAYYQAGNYTFNCRDLRKAMDLGNSEARELYYQDKFWWWDSDGKDSKYLTCESANLGKDSSSITETNWISHGNYSLNLNSIGIDFDHFASFDAITFNAEVKKEGEVNTFSVACHSKKKYDWDSEKWIKPKNRDEKSLVKMICDQKENDPEIISLLERNNWKKYSSNNWINVNGWKEDESTSYLDFDTKYYTNSDQEISEITVKCSDNEVAFLKKGKWTEYEKAKGIFKEILDDKCDSVTSAEYNNLMYNNNEGELVHSLGVREWERNDGRVVVFDPYYLGKIPFGEEFRTHKTLKYFYWLKENPSKQYASYIRCKGYKGIFEEDGGSYNTDESRGWVRLKLEKTSAQKDGLRIAEEYCSKRSLINYVHIDAEFNDWETW